MTSSRTHQEHLRARAYLSACRPSSAALWEFFALILSFSSFGFFCSPSAVRAGAPRPPSLLENSAFRELLPELFFAMSVLVGVPASSRSLLLLARAHPPHAEKPDQGARAPPLFSGQRAALRCGDTPSWSHALSKKPPSVEPQVMFPPKTVYKNNWIRLFSQLKCTHKILAYARKILIPARKILTCADRISLCAHIIPVSAHQILISAYKVFICVHKILMCAHKIPFCVYKILICTHKILICAPKILMSSPNLFVHAKKN